MKTQVFITCAVTGSGDTTMRSDKVPVTAAAIANDCVEAARAGAAIAHCHVRNPQTGKPSRCPHLYREVVDRVRDSGVDVVLNLTAGMGGDLVLGAPESPLPLQANTDMVGAGERLQHVRALLPEVCTLDCGTMNFAESNYIMANSPGMLRAMAREIQALGVRPEIEIFDTGHLVLAQELVAEGLIDKPVMAQLCCGIPYGIPDDLNSVMALVNNVPDDWVFSMFSIGRMQLPFVAMAALAGGNVRVGLEDNLWLKKGVLATNAQLVDRAVAVLENMGARILTPQAVRERLQLRPKA